MDKGYSTLATDRRHLTELNQEKSYSSLGRDKRLNSVERENKLLSPEKVLSLRRNSDAVTAQPLSSLFQPNNAEEVNGVGRTTSKTSRDFTTTESSRYVNETYELKSNHLSNINKHEYSSNELNSPIGHVLANKSERLETSRVDKASNVKGKLNKLLPLFFVLLATQFLFNVVSIFIGAGCHALSSRLVGCGDENRNWPQSRWQIKQLVR